MNTRLLKHSAIALLGSATLVIATAAATPQQSQYDARKGPSQDWYRDAAPSNMANINIQTPLRAGSVYLDGRFVGTVDRVRDLPVLPGTHNLELRGPDGRTLYEASVAAVAGETVALRPLENVPGIAPVGVPIVGTGNLLIQSPAPDAALFVDGQYMGMASQISSLPLVPGNHNVELRSPAGRTIYQNTVAVAFGQTTTLSAAGPAIVPNSPAFAENGPAVIPGGEPGELRISTSAHDISIFVDGTFVGSTSKIKTVSVAPGLHTVELANGTGQLIFQDQVAVAPNKTTSVRPTENDWAPE